MNLPAYTRHEFLKCCYAGAAGVVFSTILTGASTGQRPNILWLISEDTSPDIGCYGNQVVQTPKLDRLADEGVLFTNAFASGPVCSAVRSGLMTGMYQTSIGAHQHRTEQKKPLTSPVGILTEYFREAGYFTSNCAGLDYERKGKTDWNFQMNREPFDGTDWNQRRNGQPFFAQVNFNLTHRDFVRDPENPIDPDLVSIPPYYPDHPVTRRDWANYLESLQVLDRRIGSVLDRLEKEKLVENTIVFYFGDHGRPHVRDKQWLYEGGIHIPLIVRWPGHLTPGSVNDDLVSSIDFAPTTLSIAGIKVPTHMQGQAFLGSDAAKRTYIFSARDRCDGTVDRIRCIRTKHYKYIRNFFPDRPYIQFNAYKKDQYPVLTLMEVLHKRGELTPEQDRFMASSRSGEELYDLLNDPHELHNLADDPEYRKIQSELKAALDTWIRETGDKGEIPEDTDTVADARRLMDKNFMERITRKGLPADISPEDHLKYWEKRLFESQ